MSDTVEQTVYNHRIIQEVVAPAARVGREHSDINIS